ncbi:hypothetical protein [Limosilactobacillus reuteri]|uniref:hypothetical protein n=1 Tax=Limosilactobacillus reuteri TaxID=1598 RepID=UPI001CDBF227|nr:hypothetical protein [Limosilactobacillus reuteri]
MYEVVFYEDKNGNSEIGDYFEKISQSKQKQDKAIYLKMRHQIKMLQALGPVLHTPQAVNYSAINDRASGNTK